MNTYNLYNNYYILYKIKTSPILWVVDILENINDELIKNIQNYTSDIETYYLIYKVNDNTDILKRFNKFKIDNSCKLITSSD